MSTQTLLFAELAPDPCLGFPEPLSDRYRPQTIAEFAGLSEVKKVLAGFVQRPTNAGFLFLGSAGTGKTSMGFALARELGGFVHHVKAGDCTVEKIRSLAFACWHCVPQGFRRHVVIVDEADQMSSAAQLAVLSYLDGTETIPDTVWVFTANETDRLAERFISRNRVLDFSNYRMQKEAALYLASVWNREASADVPRPNFARVIKEQNGNVRAALMVLETKLYAGV